MATIFGVNLAHADKPYTHRLGYAIVLTNSRGGEEAIEGALPRSESVLN